MRWKPDGRRTQGADVLQPVLPLDTTLRLVMNQSAEFSDEEAVYRKKPDKVFAFWHLGVTRREMIVSYCRTPRQMQLANAFCRYLEVATAIQ